MRRSARAGGRTGRAWAAATPGTPGRTADSRRSRRTWSRTRASAPSRLGAPRGPRGRGPLVAVVRRHGRLDVVRVGLAAALAQVEARDGDRKAALLDVLEEPREREHPGLLQADVAPVLDVPLSVGDVGQRR